MAEFSTIQIKVAEAAASVDAARLVLLRDVEAVTRAVREQGEASIEQRVNSRRGQAFAINLAMRAANILNAAAGGSGLQTSNPIQRAWRDVNAVGRHVSLNWDAVGGADRWLSASNRAVSTSVKSIRRPTNETLRLGELKDGDFVTHAEGMSPCL